MLAVTIHVDGACHNNGSENAIGGFGCILIGSGSYKLLAKEVCGTILSTTDNRITNQRAEITAVIYALRLLKRPCKVSLCSDSQYVISTMRDGWKRKVNLDLWTELDDACKTHSVEWIWVRGHSRNSYNIRCDELAQEAIRNNYVLPKQRLFKLVEVQNEIQPSM